MTHKDYELIARALRGSRESWDAQRNDSHELPAMAADHACIFVADALATDNPRFDRERFLAACGVGA